MENIKRREALRRTAWIMGGALAAPTISGILNGCTPKPDLTWTPTFFDEEQARLVMQLSETILPETDTPGAKSLGVPGFVEEMVKIVYSDEDRNKFMQGMKAFDAACEKEAGSGFVALSAEKQTSYLKQIDQTAKDRKLPEDIHVFYWRLKEMTIVGYYTTEYGATQALQYIAVPVEQHGCLPLSETGNGKTWAT